MNEVVRKVIEAGIRAPSGDNCQPWRFEVRGNEINVFNLPERDISLYSWGERASLVAHGALLENMAIAASVFGHNARIEPFPKSKDENFIARVILDEAAPREEPLYSFIFSRCTNRKPYEKKLLTSEQKKNILDSCVHGESGEFFLIEDNKNIETLARAASVNERILFENKEMHSFFFSHINWSAEEDAKNTIGFYIKTLELPPPAVPVFKMAKNWKMINLLNKIGFSRMIAAQNARTYSACSAMGAIVIKDISPRSFVWVGRLLERMWLKTAVLGFSLQPLTGVLFLMLRVWANDMDKLSSSHVALLENTYEKMKSAIGLKDGVVAFLFRIGEGGEPSGRSSRFSIEDSVLLK